MKQMTHKYLQNLTYLGQFPLRFYCLWFLLVTTIVQIDRFYLLSIIPLSDTAIHFSVALLWIRSFFHCPFYSYHRIFFSLWIITSCIIGKGRRNHLDNNGRSILLSISEIGHAYINLMPPPPTGIKLNTSDTQKCRDFFTQLGVRMHNI